MALPTSTAVDRTALLLTRGYDALPSLRRRHATDALELRLLGQRMVCVSGPDGARLLYDEQRFARHGALPRLVRRTLLGEDGVQTLDDSQHEHRKAMFMSLMTPDSVQRLAGRTAELWTDAARRWALASRVVLFDEASHVLLCAAGQWTGVPVPERDVAGRARQLTALVDGFATVAPRHWRARLERRRLDDWAADLVRQVRDGHLEPPVGSALEVFALHRDAQGRRLDERVAAVELLNVVRPVVAIAWYVTFLADALHTHPQWRARLRAGDEPDLERFVQEVRRLYPFTPFVGARVRTGFTWRGHEFPVGRLVLLDVYGSLHDRSWWADPYRFDPDRFRGWTPSPYDFIPQGGGEYGGHRCAGEQVTIALMKVALSWLAGADYELPAQDMTIPLHRIPTRPRSGVVLNRVRT